MTYLIFVLESIKRHARFVVVLTLAALLCGAGLSAFQALRSQAGSSYIAEVTFYVDGHESDEVKEYNYELNEDYLASDIRRIIVSGKVAGEVRKEYGSEVSITTPYWVNRETKNNIYSHYIYAEVSAPTAELALAAAQAVAERTLVQVDEQLDVSTIQVAEGPLLKTVSGMAADYGVDDIDDAAFKQDPRLIDPKTLIVVAFCGLALAILVSVLKDLRDGRIHSKNDVVRLFGVPVLDVVPRDQVDQLTAFYRSATILGSLAKRDGLASVGVCGMGLADEVGAAARCLGEACDGFSVACAVDLLDGGSAMLALSKVDAVLLVVEQGSGGAKQLGTVSDLLNASEIPCAGALLITEQSPRAN